MRFKFYDGVLSIILVSFSSTVGFVDIVTNFYLGIPVSHNVSTTSSYNLFKFSFSSLHKPVRATQDLLEYISNSSVFAVSCS